MMHNSPKDSPEGGRSAAICPDMTDGPVMSHIDVMSAIVACQAYKPGLRASSNHLRTILQKTPKAASLSRLSF